MSARPGNPRSPRTELRRHWVFSLVLAGGIALRALTLLAYRPALEFSQDSFTYLYDARGLGVDMVRPIGYPIFLHVMAYGHHLVAVAVVQHGLGLGSGVLLYALLLGLGVRSWLAALATVPVLLDAYQVYLESFVLSDALFGFLLVGALFLLLRRDRPAPSTCLLVGLLLAAACLTRTTGLFVLIPVLVYLVVVRVGALRLGAAAGGALLVLGGYAAWFHANTGHFGFERYSGYFLAGRVQPFADCKGLDLPALERRLCDARPPAQRPSTDYYIWNPHAPLRRPDVPAGTDRNAVAADFARRIIAHQPGAYAAQAAHDVLHYFSPGHSTDRQDFGIASWQFLTTSTPDPWQPLRPPDNIYVGVWTDPGAHTQHQVKVANQGFGNTEVAPHINTGIAGALRHYQDFGYLPGPLLALCLLLAVGGGIGRLDQAERRLRAIAVLLAGAGLFVLLAPAMTAVFDYRYLLPALSLLPPAGVLGITLIERRVRARHHSAAAPSGDATFARYTGARQSGLAQR